MSRPHPGRDHELVLMQTLIAKRWLKKGKAISDLHAKFIFFFTGIKALYFVWYDTERENSARGLARVVVRVSKSDI